MVGVTGLEPATSCTPSKHSSQTELHPVALLNYSIGYVKCKGKILKFGCAPGCKVK